MTNDINELSIAKFSQYLIAQFAEFDHEIDRTTALMAPLFDKTIDELDEMELGEYKVLANEFKAAQPALLDNLLKQEVLKDFTSKDGTQYRVEFITDDDFFLKKSEHKFLFKRIYTPDTSDRAKSKVMHDNLHVIAAIIFRPQGSNWQTEKFSEEKVLALAEKLKDDMQIKYIYPYQELILKKFATA